MIYSYDDTSSWTGQLSHSGSVLGPLHLSHGRSYSRLSWKHFQWLQYYNGLVLFFKQIPAEGINIYASTMHMHYRGIFLTTINKERIFVQSKILALRKKWRSTSFSWSRGDTAAIRHRNALGLQFPAIQVRFTIQKISAGKNSNENFKNVQREVVSVTQLHSVSSMHFQGDRIIVECNFTTINDTIPIYVRKSTLNWPQNMI